jgi:predicted nuclease of predicted toxin-antitoxin system
VRDVGLASTDDRAVWEYAKANGLVIVSKDGDFRRLSFLFGAPPKVAWPRVGNRSTPEIENLLRSRAVDLATFETDAGAAMLVLSI